MKKLLAIIGVTLFLTTYAPQTIQASERAPQGSTDITSIMDLLIKYKQEQTLLEKQNAEFQAAQLRASAMTTRVNQLKQHVDKTWYVFSGITPSGWDCSGMVMWFYSKFELELEHSVSAQILSGEIVYDPMPGDIVSFKHNGSENGYHNGIYAGNGLFIHSPREGKRTALSSVSRYAGDHSVVVYTRIDVGVLE
jgi:cell wall-associated NlpC family hydrolase